MVIRTFFHSVSLAKVAPCMFALALLFSFAGQAQDPDAYTFERTWGILGTGGEEFNMPDGIASDGVGAIYVTDVTQNRVLKFDGDGAFLGVTSGANGEIPAGSVANFFGHQVLVLRVVSYSSLIQAMTKSRSSRHQTSQVIHFRQSLLLSR